jgi:hypothetical protein
MMNLVIEPEGLEEAVEALQQTGKSLGTIERKVLSTAAKGTVKAIKSAVRSSSLHRRTGELLKAYRYKYRKKKSEAVVYPAALDGSREIYPKAMTLNYGHSGPTKRASDWNIPARGFVQAGNQYAESGAYMGDVESLVQKELDKYWK